MVLCFSKTYSEKQGFYVELLMKSSLEIDFCSITFTLNYRFTGKGSFIMSFLMETRLLQKYHQLMIKR